MGTGKKLVLIDTNIFVIDLRYKQDENYRLNSLFLKNIKKENNGFTTIFNLLELCGILSFNLNEGQLLKLWNLFSQKYNVTIIPEPELDNNLPSIQILDIFSIMQNKLSLGDALMLFIAKNKLAFISTLVTWDKQHFKNKFDGKVINPADYLK